VIDREREADSEVVDAESERGDEQAMRAKVRRTLLLRDRAASLDDGVNAGEDQDRAARVATCSSAMDRIPPGASAGSSGWKETRGRHFRGVP
jgi:hypothetical protein